MAIEDLAKLPETPCVYLVVNSQGKVLYVGKSENLRKRWKSHYKLSSLIEESGIRISYVEVQEDLLFKVERALINALNPPLNENEPSKGIASLRQKVGLTQRQLADLVGVTETTIRNWENNRSGVEWFERVAKLCDSLQCTPNDLFGYQKIAETEEKT
ncbi:helix-turn-helix domain-containing protein [Nostoc sp. LEGE 12450]|uniref:helix-turn-helix domain-containing protein n=1 Tax=Nostoc sp. LEGE 12450 TaxID=1828643 RepID=UPI001D13D4F7|nr:helix-turn-helix domain-containing protein [Nostoc sp. LEGE 12450]